MVAKVHLPVVEIGSLFESDREDSRIKSERINSSTKLFSAFETTGIAYLKFDGESRSLLQQFVAPAFSEAHRFFQRPLEEKQSATVKELAPGVTRGYIETAGESGAQTIEWKEAFSWSYDWSNGGCTPQNALQSENVWPLSKHSTPDMLMKNSFDALFSFMTRVMLVLVDAIMTAWPDNAGLIPDLRTLCREGESISLLRSFHYHGTESAEKHMTGSSAHTDWGFATLIAQKTGSKSALQICVQDEWHDVAPMEDTVVVNCSDFLSLLTRGRLRSPLHRVILTDQERLSFVFFQYPGFDTAVPAIRDEDRRKLVGLSLLHDQSADDGENDGFAKFVTDDMSFGQLIACKWQQVSRR